MAAAEVHCPVGMEASSDLVEGEVGGEAMAEGEALVARMGAGAWAMSSREIGA